MRTTIIPAQITSVEDTIAGNLNLQQIVLFILSLFINTFLYALLPMRLAFTFYKIPIMIAVFVVCIGLSLRIKQRIVLDWLVVFVRYAIRPHLYFFNKNSEVFRSIVVEKVILKQSFKQTPILDYKLDRPNSSAFDYTSLLRNPSLNIQFKRNRVQVIKNYE